MMNDYFKIAWRNLWRNRRRTAITSASILFAVFFALLMRSMQLGSYDNMIKNAIERYSGFIQIQTIEFKDDPGLDNALEYSNELITRLDALNGVKAVVPRVESFALASYNTQTKGVVVLGVDVEREKKLSNPNSCLVKYRITTKNIEEIKKTGIFPEHLVSKIEKLKESAYANVASLELDLGLTEEESAKFLPQLEPFLAFESEELKAGDDGIMISSRLARFLKLDIGDTLVLMGQGYHGTSAAGLFPVRAIVKLPSPELDNKVIYMNLSKAQEFFGLEKQATSIAINLTDNSEKSMETMQEAIRNTLDDSTLTVKNWKEFNKVLHQQIESDNQSGKVMLGLLYFIIFFGIFGTVLMMIHERYREFGVLVSIGMQKIKLAVILLIEMTFMGLMGVVSGTILALPFLYLGNRYPVRLTGEMATMMESYGMEAIMPLAWVDMYVLWQGFVVALMVILSCLYPLRKVMKLKEVEALRS